MCQMLALLVDVLVGVVALNVFSDSFVAGSVEMRCDEGNASRRQVVALRQNHAFGLGLLLQEYFVIGWLVLIHSACPPKGVLTNAAPVCYLSPPFRILRIATEKLSEARQQSRQFASELL